MADTPMNLDQVLTASYADAITLGVHGIDAAALARRADAARAVLAEQAQRSDAAYRAARWNDEPDLPEPFGASLVALHNGDLDRVIADPEFTRAVQRQMGLDSRHERVDPTAEDLDAVRTQTTQIRDELRTRGLTTGAALPSDAAVTSPRDTVDAVVAQAPNEEWVARARLSGELACDTLANFLDERGLAGTNWDPREEETAPSKSIDDDTLRALEDHERLDGKFRTIATLASRYEEAVVSGAVDADGWRADVIAAVDDYGLTGTGVDPRGVRPAEELTASALADQHALAPAARTRMTVLEREAAGVEESIAAFGPDDALRTRSVQLGRELSALHMFAVSPASPDLGQPTASAAATTPSRTPQLDPSRIAAEIQSGARADLWDESDWPDRESDEELAPMVSVALRRPVQETIESREFVEFLSSEIAEARTVGEALPEVTAEDRAEALRLAPQVWDALIDRGEQLPPQPEWWRTERERLRAESPTLHARMEQAYLDGYDERIRTGLAYDDADAAGKEQVGTEVLTAKVLAYDELGRLTSTLDAELPGVERFYGEGSADQPLTSAAEAALERSAHLAGRWAALDAGADDLIAGIDSRTLEVTHAPSVYAGDPRDALFNYLDPDAQRAQRALPQIERDTTIRAARAMTASTPPQERGGVFERLRERRDQRRAQTASLTDPGRQTVAPQQAQTIQ